jgi:nitrite reductase/ring-hydroxylating ferredoxin subunit
MNTRVSNDSSPADGCDAESCSLPANRRQFLRDTFLSVAGALVAVGVGRSTAFAMPLEFIEAAGAKRNLISYSVPAADGAQVDKTNDVILVRWQQALYAFNLSCPHQNTALKWNDGDHTFRCPKHHSAFRPDGEYIPDSGRATRAMDRFAITLDGASVSVDVDKMYQDDTDGPQWAAAVVKLP